MKRYYRHNQTMPIVFGGHKLKSGDEFIEQDDGTITIKRDGKILYDSVLTKAIPIVEQEVKAFVEDTFVVPSKVKKTKRHR
jgi:hypothetical protein